MDTTSENESRPRAASALQDRTFICSVVFLRLPDYSRKPVVEQARIRERLNAVISAALGALAPDQRIVLDAGDGMAIGFLGPAEDALIAAAELRDALSQGEEQAIPVRAGINYGPIKLVKDEGGRPRVVGDGISVAQRMAEFAADGQIFSSHSFYEVVSCLSEQYGQLFHYQGARTDPHVREHQVYALDPPAAGIKESAGATGRFRSLRAREALDTRIRGSRPAGENGRASRPGRNPLLIATLAAALILGSAVALRAWKHEEPPAPAANARQAPSRADASGRVPKPQEVVPKVFVPEPAAIPLVTPAPKPPSSEEAPASTARARQTPSGADAPGRVPKPQEAAPKVVVPEPAAIPRPTPVPKAPPGEAARGVVSLAISPWGEVYVNGEYQGVSPPMAEIALPPGRHRIEIRNEVSRPHVRMVRIKGQERIRIKYRFR